MPGLIKRKTNTVQNVAILKVLLNAIAFTPRSQPEIQALTGLANSTVSRWLRILHTRTPTSINLVYIAEWYKQGVRKGQPVAKWKVGIGELDALRPKPMSSAEYQRRWKRKQVTEVSS